MDKALLKDTLKDGIMGTWENEPLIQQTYSDKLEKGGTEIC